MTTAVPQLAFVDRAIDLENGGGFELTLTRAAFGADLSLVIDVYDLDAAVHPGGHVGWWSFPVGEVKPAIAGRLDGRTGVATLDGRMAAAHWVNRELTLPARLLVHAVLRSKTTNAIVDIDRVVALRGAAAIAGLRSGFNRDWSQPRYAPAPFVLGRGQTVHLVTPHLSQRDAVGELCLELFRMLRQNGVGVQLHATHIDLPLGDIVGLQKELPAKVGARDQIVYFCSTYDPLLPSLLAIACRSKSAYFHGITDPTKLRVFDPELSVVCAKALEALGTLRGFDRLAANSAHSAAALAAATGAAPQSIQIIAPTLIAAGVRATGPGVERRKALLTVCQLRPHKRVEDVLRLFAAYLEHDAGAECWVVGRSPNRAYREYLGWVEKSELSLPTGAVKWLGSIDNAALDQLYATAAAYVSMSEDEGFCLPLFEAARHGLPVFAYRLPAVLETLGGTGVTFVDKDFPHLAGALHSMLDDAPRRDAVAKAQAARAEVLAAQMSGAGFYRLLEQ